MSQQSLSDYDPVTVQQVVPQNYTPDYEEAGPSNAVFQNEKVAGSQNSSNWEGALEEKVSAIYKGKSRFVLLIHHIRALKFNCNYFVFLALTLSALSYMD